MPLSRLPSLVDFSILDKSGDSQKASQYAWETIWSDFRKRAGEEPGLQKCFGNAWLEYEQKYGKVPLGSVPEMKI